MKVGAYATLHHTHTRREAAWVLKWVGTNILFVQVHLIGHDWGAVLVYLLAANVSTMLRVGNIDRLPSLYKLPLIGVCRALLCPQLPGLFQSITTLAVPHDALRGTREMPSQVNSLKPYARSNPGHVSVTEKYQFPVRVGCAECYQIGHAVSLISSLGGTSDHPQFPASFSVL